MVRLSDRVAVEATRNLAFPFTPAARAEGSPRRETGLDGVVRRRQT